jgi:hypothetical protein
LEFHSWLSGVAGQDAGFLSANGLQPPYAVFGTSVAGTLLARSALPGTPGTTIETPIVGTWFAGPHTFRIDWNAAAIVYWIDNKKVATHAISLTGLMQPGALDLTVGDGPLGIDWMRMTPYAAAGNYTSAVFDAGAVVNWLTTSWTAAMPTGTNIVIQYRTGNTATPDDGTWTPLATIPTSGAALSGSSRYFQFTVRETTTNSGQTPVVKDVTLGFQR